MMTGIRIAVETTNSLVLPLSLAKMRVWGHSRNQLEGLGYAVNLLASPLSNDINYIVGM
jgi:hypothetical protein